MWFSRAVNSEHMVIGKSLRKACGCCYGLILWISANQDEMLTWIGFLGDKTRPGWWV
jgi:hypothetical protein